MSVFLRLFILGILVFIAPACANKGKLKTPSQIAAEQEKKAKKTPGDSDGNGQAENPAPADGPIPPIETPGETPAIPAAPEVN